MAADVSESDAHATKAVGGEMTPHLHREFVPGCYRCDLSRDELDPIGAVIEAQQHGHLAPTDGETAEAPMPDFGSKGNV